MMSFVVVVCDVKNLIINMVKHHVEKLSARVFCHLNSGGNPVTIFSSQAILPPAIQVKLAQGSPWESVMVARQSMAFYMPTGEKVSFCAHAAMGGTLALVSPSSLQAPEQQQVSFRVSSKEDYKATVLQEQSGTSILLDMTAPWTVEPVPDPSRLEELLRNCNLTPQQVDSSSSLPTLVNASIARPKTLVYLNSLDALHQAIVPPDIKEACDDLDSTGLYLYAKQEDNDAWECRQFPRASGYPEDPATGIAAAALAVALHSSGRDSTTNYTIYQGTAMGKPSCIKVNNLRLDDKKATFQLAGLVQLDEQETLQVE
jgi:PhzF family phenazine biosynthesis protein